MTASLIAQLTLAYSSHPDPNRIKALILTNPHNPLSLCYSPSVLRQCMSWCHKRGIHFVSDEMYAMSTILTPGEDVKPGVQPFVSALQIAGLNQDDVKGGESRKQKIVDTDYSKTHVVWGMSKDFGSSGIRMVRS